MKRLVAGMGLAIGLALGPTAGSAQTDCLSIPPDCNVLCFFINIGTTNWAIDAGSLNCTSNTTVLSALPNFLMLATDELFRGPDCTIRLSPSTNPDLFATLTISQDYCALKAGEVFVTSNYGPAPQYTTKEGQYASPTSGGLIILSGFDTGSCINCDTAKPSGRVDRIGTSTGSVNLAGHFAVSEPLDLGAATVTLRDILQEFGGATLVTNAGGGALPPMTLLAKRGSTAESAIFETPARQRPSVRLALKKRGERLDVELRVDLATIQAPERCEGTASLVTTLAAVHLSIDDGVNAPVILVPPHRWECRTDRTGAVKELRLLGPVTAGSSAHR
jgi:hypothetical protein